VPARKPPLPLVAVYRKGCLDLRSTLGETVREGRLGEQVASRADFMLWDRSTSRRQSWAALRIRSDFLSGETGRMEPIQSTL